MDGLNAYTLGDLRAVCGSETFNHMYSAYRSNNSDLPAYEAIGIADRWAFGQFKGSDAGYSPRADEYTT